MPRHVIGQDDQNAPGRLDRVPRLQFTVPSATLLFPPQTNPTGMDVQSCKYRPPLVFRLVLRQLLRLRHLWSTLPHRSRSSIPLLARTTVLRLTQSKASLRSPEQSLPQRSAAPESIDESISIELKKRIKDVSLALSLLSMPYICSFSCSRIFLSSCFRSFSFYDYYDCFLLLLLLCILDLVK